MSVAFLKTLLVMTLAVNHVLSQDAASLITGLLSTFAESSRSPGCPGECRHPLSALFCSYVQDDADCGDSKLRCCTDPPPEVPSSDDDHHHHHHHKDDIEEHHQPSPFDPDVNFNHTVADEIDPPDINRPPDRDHTFHRPPMLTQATPISVGTNLTVRPGVRIPGDETPSRKPSSRRPLRRRTTSLTTTTTSSSEVTFIPTPAALTNSRGKPCHGICVTRMVASFCSQIYEPGQCSPDEACCLTGDEVMETETPPSSSAFQGSAEAIESLPSTPPSTTTSTTTAPSTIERRGTSSTTHWSSTTSLIKSSPGTTAFPDETTTVVTVIRKPRPRPSSSTRRPVIIDNRNKHPSTRVPPRQPTDDDGGGQVEDDTGSDGDCPGSCIMGLLTLLCDSVDSSVTCSNGGQCCISKSSPPSGDGDAMDPTKESDSRPPSNCPGICLPSMLTGVCNRPAVLIPNVLDCDAGTVCCDNSLRETGQPTTTTTASPLMDLLSWPLKLAAASSALSGDGSDSSSSSSASSGISSALALGSALSGLFSSGGGGSTNGGTSQMGGPSMFGNAGQPVPSSSQIGPAAIRPSVDRTQGVPECPGTCIASFLKMTCFGSSLIVESLSCPKDNLICCAPKSSLIGLNPEFMNNDNHWNQTANHLSPTDSSNVIGYTQRPSTSNRYVCGIKGAVRPETPRVVGGRDASPGEWCWQVALINSLNQYLCGGALIGRRWVLTAAHCVTNLIRSGDAIYIRVGDYDLTSKYGSPGAQTLRVATTYIHHNHNSQTLDNNIALLKLEKPVDLKEGICLVCLPARGVTVQSGKHCFVTGYGYMGESGPIPLRIRAAVLPVVSEKECVRKINAVTEKIFILPASSFCAGGEEGHDACQGDGGGPLSCEVDGYFEITGIVSWGFGCGRLDVPGIYVKVSSFIGWINQIISVNNI